MLFFKWIRDSVRNAILGGVQDALEHMDAVATERSPDKVDLLAGLKVELTLPGPVEKRKR
jgi:hypothetical protein